jgi:four helix bundle protein
MINLKHKKLNVWKLSIELTAIIYDLTQDFPDTERFGLISQLRRASVSISSNLAEGASRSSVKERCRFYEIARSSLVEIDTQLEIALLLNYFTEVENSDLADKMNHLFAMLSNLIKKTK